MQDRESLGKKALEAVCTCLYFELADNLDITPDAELLAIIEGKITCDCDE